jgi:hypothetical protein
MNHQNEAWRAQTPSSPATQNYGVPGGELHIPIKRAEAVKKLL